VHYAAGPLCRAGQNSLTRCGSRGPTRLFSCFAVALYGTVSVKRADGASACGMTARLCGAGNAARRAPARHPWFYPGQRKCAICWPCLLNRGAARSWRHHNPSGDGVIIRKASLLTTIRCCLSAHHHSAVPILPVRPDISRRVRCLLRRYTRLITLPRARLLFCAVGGRRRCRGARQRTWLGAAGRWTKYSGDERSIFAGLRELLDRRRS